MFGTEEGTRTVKVRYLIINTPYLYNMIIGRPDFNLIRDTMSIMYLCMTYPQSTRRIDVIQRDQETAKRCYIYSLKLKKANKVVVNSKQPEARDVNVVDMKQEAKTHKIVLVNEDLVILFYRNMKVVDKEAIQRTLISLGATTCFFSLNLSFGLVKMRYYLCQVYFLFLKHS